MRADSSDASPSAITFGESATGQVNGLSSTPSARNQWDHAARRVGLKRALEGHPVVLPREGVVIGHRDVELFLGRGIALHFEVHLAELGGHAAGVVLGRGRRGAEADE